MGICACSSSFLLNHYQQFEALLHARDESTSLFTVGISFVFHCIVSELVSYFTCSIAYTSRQHGRSVIIPLL